MSQRRQHDASGCSGKLPDKNRVYTPAGLYTMTIACTDGFLVQGTPTSCK